MSERQLTLLSLALFVVLGAALVWVQFFAPCSFCRAISTVADLPARCLP
jgi:hypothetical protein